MEQQLVEVGPVDRLVARIAARQHGLITYPQLVGLGLSRSAIARRVSRGALYRVHRGVYAVRYPELSCHGEWLAAVLALGSGAALSHRTAAALWGLLPVRGPRIDVTVPTTGGRARRRLIVVHRLELGPEEVVVREGIPVTTPLRTVIDRLTERRTLDEAAFLDLDLTELGSAAEATSGRRPPRTQRGSTWTRIGARGGDARVVSAGELPAPKVNSMWRAGRPTSIGRHSAWSSRLTVRSRTADRPVRARPQARPRLSGGRMAGHTDHPPALARAGSVAAQRGACWSPDRDVVEKRRATGA